VLTLDGSRTASAIATAVTGLGGGVLGFSRLPLVAARLTARQITLVRSLLGVKAIYLDRPLELMLAQSRRTLRADLQVDATTCAIGATDLLGYTCASGTSMAAPHVAGVIALMLDANPSLTPDQIKATLRATARPMAGYGEWEVGAGYVDALAAVDAVD
jgi:Subtilase family